MIGYLRWLCSLPARYSELQDQHLALLDRYSRLQHKHLALQDQYEASLQELIGLYEAGTQRTPR